MGSCDFRDTKKAWPTGFPRPRRRVWFGHANEIIPCWPQLFDGTVPFGSAKSIHACLRLGRTTFLKHSSPQPRLRVIGVLPRRHSIDGEGRRAFNIRRCGRSSALLVLAWIPMQKKKPSARQLVRQDGGVTAPRAGRDRPGWPMAAHQLASAYKKSLTIPLTF